MSAPVYETTVCRQCSAKFTALQQSIDLCEKCGPDYYQIARPRTP